MLSHQDNELITRVGPGTPMGELMRQYWIPALLSTELPAPDCDPVRVMLLGEPLIAFRATDGQVGLLANHCPHRGASLFFGRNEQQGLRCVYHGWKFDVSGACVDMPNEPVASDFKLKVKAVAYRCQERGGIVWAYMGVRHIPPPMPDIEANELPDDRRKIAILQRECNWLQALEGDIDTCHLGFLHLGAVDADSVDRSTWEYYILRNRAPRYAVVDTPGGAMYGAYRPAESGLVHWRIGLFLFPFYTLIGTNVLGKQILWRMWVPMDDTHTMMFSSGTSGEMEGDMLPNSSDWFGRFRSRTSVSNDYFIDRGAQRRRESFTGIARLYPDDDARTEWEINLEDQAITETMGPILDRSNEHVGTSDVMVIRVRKRLIAAAKDLVERRIPPPGVDDPRVYRVRSGGVVLPEGADWIQATKHLREAYVEHAELAYARPSL